MFSLDPDWLAYNTRIITLFCLILWRVEKERQREEAGSCLLFMTICHCTSYAETRTVTLEGNSLKRFQMDLINSALPLFYLRLERAGLCGFCMVLCRIRCQTIVIKMGSEEEVVRQKAIFLGMHLWYSVTKIICSQFFPIIQSFKNPLKTSYSVGGGGNKPNPIKFHTLVTFFELAHHFRACSHYSQFYMTWLQEYVHLEFLNGDCCYYELFISVTITPLLAGVF